jgi:hypothetical protein
MDNRGFFQLIGDAWRGTFEAIRRHETLFVIVFALLYCLKLAFGVLNPPVHHAIGAPRLTDSGAAWGLLNDVLESVISGPLLLAVYRYILCGEIQKAPINLRRLISFSIYLVSVELVSSLPAHLESTQTPHSYAQIFWIVVSVISLIALIRLLFVYPAAALDSPFVLSEGWNKSRGHWWYIAGFMTCGLMPILLVGFATLFVLHAHPLQTLPPGREALVTVFATFFDIATTLVGAGLISELYRKFGEGHELANHREPIGSHGKSGARLGSGARIGFVVVFCTMIAQQIWPHADNLVGFIAISILLLCGLFVAGVLIVAKFRRSRIGDRM